ncbi:MAG: hypothetical protein IH851_08755 [Armatimonadetes bacterium]|nr:hypothetical protein [Armatimonadota bacterium]
MKPEERLAKLEDALRRIEDGTRDLSEQLPAMRSFAEKARKTEQALEQSRSKLAESEKREKTATVALEGIEQAIMKAMDAAKGYVHKPEYSLEERLTMMRLCRKAFSKLSAAGFDIWIPEIGDAVDPAKHTVSGRAKSKLGGDRVADVVSWGYSFPGGEARAAEVLVGDGSLARKERTEKPRAAKPKVKAGIAMVVDDKTARTKKGARKTAKKVAATPFDQLAQAANRNIQKPK